MVTSKPSEPPDPADPPDPRELPDPLGAEAMFPQVYDELRRLAGRKLSAERADHTLQPTALVHEAWVRLRNDQDQRFEDRDRFLRAAASAMRRILVDHARKKATGKRGGGLREETLDGQAAPDRPEELLLVEEALVRLAEADPRKARVVELRFFGGLEQEEIARALGLSERTVKRDWAFARAWLFREVQGRGPDRS